MCKCVHVYVCTVNENDKASMAECSQMELEERRVCIFLAKEMFQKK